MQTQMCIRDRFIRAIPYNYYSLMTLAFILLITFMPVSYTHLSRREIRSFIIEPRHSLPSAMKYFSFAERKFCTLRQWIIASLYRGRSRVPRA